MSCFLSTGTPFPSSENSSSRSLPSIELVSAILETPPPWRRELSNRL
jgi:hypothetical protein